MPHELERFQQVLTINARDRGDAIAIQGANRRLSWMELRVEVEGRVQVLRQQAPGALVLAMDNGPEALLWDLAALFAERPCVFIPSFFSAAQFEHCLQQSGATLALAEVQWSDHFAEQGFSQHDGFWRRAVAAPVALPGGTAKITYTSGSTGRPKGVCLSADMLALMEN